GPQVVRMVGGPGVPHAPSLDERLPGLPRFLDRGLRVRVVQVEDVEIRRSQTPQAVLDIAVDAVPSQTFDPPALAIRQGATLGEEQDPLTPSADRASDQLFGAPPAIERRGIDPIDAAIQSGVDRADGSLFVLRPPRDPPRRGRADRRGTNADRRDLEITLAKRSQVQGHDAASTAAGNNAHSIHLCDIWNTAHWYRRTVKR